MCRLKTISLFLLSLALIVSIAGSGYEDDAFTDGVNIYAAMNTYPPDAVMISSGNLFLPWGLLYFYMHNTASQISYYFQEPVDWQEFYGDGTLADAVKAYAADQAIQFLVYEYAFSLYDISLNELEAANLRQLLDNMIAEAGGLEYLTADLQAEGFINLSVYEQWLRNYILQEKLPSVMYGDSYMDISDDAVADYAFRNGYLRAKHILLLNPSESGGYSPQEVEDAKKANYERLELIISDLSAYRDDPDFEARFSRLVLEHSEDPGSVNFPDGYLFQFPDMVPQFSVACESLDFGRMSGIVETDYGYHVILRLPLDYDNIVPIGVANAGQSYTLRQLATFDDFENNLFRWYESMDFEFSPDFDMLDVATLFAWHE